MTLALHIREASLADVPAVLNLVQSAYRGDASRRGWTTEADLLDGQRTDEAEVRSLIDPPRSRILLSYAGEELVGCVWLAAEGDCAHVGMFAVKPTLQSQGIGRTLLTRAEQITREELDLAQTELSVITQRAELIAWYERRGYQKTGQTLPFPYGNARFGLPRRADLCFDVMRKHLDRI